MIKLGSDHGGQFTMPMACLTCNQSLAPIDNCLIYWLEMKVQHLKYLQYQEKTSNNELFSCLFGEGALCSSVFSCKVSAEAVDSCFLISSCNMSFVLAFAKLLSKSGL